MTGIDYNKFKGWASCQDWMLLRETDLKLEDATLLVGWFITSRGAILQVETIAGMVECISAVPLMAPEAALQLNQKPKRPKRGDRDEDEPNDKL